MLRPVVLTHNSTPSLSVFGMRSSMSGGQFLASLPMIYNDLVP